MFKNSHNHYYLNHHSFHHHHYHHHLCLDHYHCDQLLNSMIAIAGPSRRLPGQAVWVRVADGPHRARVGLGQREHHGLCVRVRLGLGTNCGRYIKITCHELNPNYSSWPMCPACSDKFRKEHQMGILSNTQCDLLCFLSLGYSNPITPLHPKKIKKILSASSFLQSREKTYRGIGEMILCVLSKPSPKLGGGCRMV